MITYNLKGEAKMKKMYLRALLTTFVLLFCLSPNNPAIAASAEEDVLRVATDFVKAWNTLDFDLLSSLYFHSPKTNEFGPSSYDPFLYQGWETLEKEWGIIFELPPGTIIISLHDLKATILKDDVAVVTAYHNFTYTNPETKEQSIQQHRITHVVQKINGKWLIVHHHASEFALK